jgi:hypothetical protein
MGSCKSEVKEADEDIPIHNISPARCSAGFPGDSSGPQINRALINPHQAANQCTVAGAFTVIRHACPEAMMVNRTPEIATLLRQKPAAAEGRMAKSTPTLDALRDRMEALRRDQNALHERLAALNCEIAKSQLRP